MYGIEPEDDASSADFYSGGCIPKIGPSRTSFTRAVCLEKLILRQIFGLFVQTERS